MRNKLFCLVFIALFFLGLGLFVLPQKEDTRLENRALKTIHNIQINDFLSSAEEVMKDQFYGRDILNKLYRKIDLMFNEPFSRIYANGLNMYYLEENVIGLDGGYLINQVIEYDEDSLHSASSRGYNINEMDLKYPNIKTYVYFPTRIEEILAKTSYGESKYQSAFVQQLNADISYSSLQLHSVEDHKNYYYKSDFHWTNKGAYQGYADIINMISKDYNLDEVKEPIEEITYPYEFRGNISTRIAGLSECDYISDYIFDLGDYKYYVNGKEADLNDAKKEYAEYGNKSGGSDYEYYFGENSFLRVFDFDNEDKPNILIFCDSYINVNMSWIASHFNKTVMVDLRAKDDTFSLDEIINEYGIDIILVTMRYSNLITNGNMYIPLN